MNPNTNHLIDLESMTEKEKNEMTALADYVEVPEDLREASRRKLNGKPEAFVSKTSGGKLSKFASGQRKMQRNQRR